MFHKKGDQEISVEKLVDGPKSVALREAIKMFDEALESNEVLKAQGVREW
jgi:hypothetical protein